MNWLRANRLSAQNPLESPAYDLNMRSSVDVKRNSNQSLEYNTPGKIKSNPSFSLSKGVNRSQEETGNAANYAGSKKKN